MERLELHQNLADLRRQLASEADQQLRSALRLMIRSMERELALFDARISGASLSLAGAAPNWKQETCPHDRHFRKRFEASPNLLLLLDPRAGLHIIDMNDAYAKATMVDRSSVAGRRLFDVFPDNPEDADADGVSNLFDSLRTAAITLRPDYMGVTRYDMRDPSGKFFERYWRPVNRPVLDASGKLRYLLHSLVDLTDEVRSSSNAAGCRS